MSVVTDYPALVHRDDAAADGIDDAFVVRREDDRRTEVVYFFQDLDDVVRVDRIEIARRLVSDDDVGLIDDRSSDGDPLRLAAGKLARKTPDLRHEIDELEDMGHVGLDIRVRPFGRLHGESDVLENGLVGDEAKILKDRADAAAVFRHVFFLHRVDVFRFEKNGAAARLLLGKDHLHERGLAGARVADDRDEFFRFYQDGDVVERHGIVGIDFGDFIEFDHELSL